MRSESALLAAAAAVPAEVRESFPAYSILILILIHPYSYSILILILILIRFLFAVSAHGMD